MPETVPQWVLSMIVALVIVVSIAISKRRKRNSGPRLILVDPEATEEEQARQIVQAIEDVGLQEEE